MSRRVIRILGAAVVLAGAALAGPPALATQTSAPQTAAPQATQERTAVGGGTGLIFRMAPSPEDVKALHVCTMTAVGRDRTGNLVGLTNAHCFIDENGKKLVGEKVYRDSSPAGTAFAPAPLDKSRPDLDTGVIGEVTYVSTPNNLLNSGPDGLDFAVIKLDESRVRATNKVGDVTIDKIGAPPANGTRMCKQGHRTGTTCGVKVGTHNQWFTHLVWTDGGDSGSPVVAGSTLVGNAWGVQHSSSILDIIAEMDDNGGVGAGFHLDS
ncbi:peptidase S1 [Streptomyces sp. NA04227]|uniref:peptidase S1 n=1 Tax=Streptomyces sp. NA04227 TaxID=2742136 RepID=UPI0015915DE4|nr:peptidase S1 [Streptomyces sp. NA04227]QKW07202.1 peptidase S1 [Streptomyces sp. NA04227]